jgi:hypothetical protein
MPIYGLSLAATQKIHSQYDDAPDDEKTVFEIGTLDSRVAGLIRDKATSVTVNQSAPDDEVESNVNMNAVYFEACVYGVKGFERFKDKDGNDIGARFLKRFHGGVSYKVMDPAIVALLPNPVVVELGQKILAGNELSPATAGN